MTGIPDARPDPDLADPGFVAVYDDLPLWSAACGEILLEEIRLAPGLRALARLYRPLGACV